MLDEDDYNLFKEINNNIARQNELIDQQNTILLSIVEELKYLR